MKIRSLEQFLLQGSTNNKVQFVLRYTKEVVQAPTVPSAIWNQAQNPWGWKPQNYSSKGEVRSQIVIKEMSLFEATNER